MNKITISTLQKLKQTGQKFSVLTAYDATFSKLMENCKIEVVLVGDSMGNVIQGHKTTVPVTMEHIIYHTECVSRANDYSLVMSDLPFMSYSTPQDTMNNASRLMQAGAHMVKLEGGDWLLDSIAMLAERGVPVCAHIGLTPQSVNAFGGFKVQGKEEAAAEALLESAKNLEQAGAAMLLMECVPAALGQKVSEALTIPTIGIGAGASTDAQVLVLQDMLGITDGKPPKFVKNFMEGSDSSIEQAIKAYKKAVTEGTFPETEHNF